MMDLIGQLTRFGVPLLGGRSSSGSSSAFCSAVVTAMTYMTYRMRGSYVTHVTPSSTVIARKGYRVGSGRCITTSPGCSPWLATSALSPVTPVSRVNPSQGAARDTSKTWYRAASQASINGGGRISSSSPANSVSPQSSRRTRGPPPHHQTQYLRLRQQWGATLPVSSPSSSPRRLFSATPRVSCSAIIPSSIMTDRDTLPGVVKPSHYDLAISSMKFDDWSYQGRVS
ncbi:hypothetical protein GGR51DRAFT_312282 [Nemania sp. FL0031]|nr:hypothetical protein GGR51DRAFT_312282 [Nemania sp. FL0031]